MSADSSTTNKFAVVGPTQSGKTCLAVGLFATNASNFTIEPVDTDGSSYLMDLKGCIAEGKWPGTTNKGTKKEIRFDFVKKGKKPIRVAFPEYGGEILASDETFKQFANEHLTKLSGVVLLINPGATAFQSDSPGLLEDAMLQYKKVLSFLRDENNGSHKAFVALTVTAADRITGDLKGKLQSFDQCVEELSNTLAVSGFRWERFDVTVTGPLKEQDKPELAKGRVNSAASPFLWLLDKLHWLPRRQVIFRKIRRVALSVGVLAALAGAWCGVDAWNDYGTIQKNESELKAAIKNCLDRRNLSKDDLGAVRSSLDALKNHRGWFRKKAVALANAFEPDVWNVYEKRINQEKSAIADNPGEYGGQCNRVDDVFLEWVPSIPLLVDKHAKLKEEWEARKPGYQDKYAVAQIRNPLMKMSGTHGREALSCLAGLYGKLAAVKPVGKESAFLRENISRDLDIREEKEWREFAIPDFGNKASTGASHDATRAFKALLEDWMPVTTNGAAAKAELMAQVTNSIPTWRLSYETGTFNARIDAAKKSGTLEDLAALHPSRVETNEYLKLEYVTEQWTNGLKVAYADAYARYITNFVNKVTKRRGCPKLDDADEENITHKAAVVGIPFDGTKACAAIQTAVEVRAREWRAQKRNECEGWIHREIWTGRKGDELVRAYNKEKRNRQDHEDIFNETIRRSVYLHCEKCFEDDIAYFQREYDDKSKCEKRFNEYFKRLCIILAEDTKDPDDVSWAMRFAKKCIGEGHIKDGFSSAFQETFEITEICGKINYRGENPLKGFLGTKFGVVVFRDSNKEKPTTILERDKSPRVRKNDNEWYVLSEGEGWKVYTSFADPLCMGMSIHDERDGGAWYKVECDYRNDFKSNDVQGFRRCISPFYDGTSNEVVIELGGIFGEQTKDRKLAAYVQVNMKRVSGCGICALLARAKETPKAEK